MPGNRMVTRPAILSRMVYQPGANRIEHDISAQFEQITLLFNENRLISPLKKMPNPTMLSVEFLRINPPQLTHSHREIGFRGFNQQMIMVTHQTIAVAEPPVFADDICQDGKKLAPIVIIEKDRRPSVASCSKVIVCPWVFNAEWSRHDSL